MSKLIAAINMSVDGNCDHTAGIPDEEIHEYYAEMLNGTETILYGRVTYQLMQYWQTILKNPTGEKSLDDFTKSIDKVQKIVFSSTLKDTDWKTAKLATKSIEEVVKELKQNSSKDFFVGSPGLISELTKLGLIDEYQLCIHPVIAGSGLHLFKEVKEMLILKLIKTKIFNSGAIILYYEPKKDL